MKKIYFAISVILVMIVLSVYGCSSTTTVFQQSTTTVTQIVPTTIYVTQPPVETTSITNLYGWNFDINNLQKISLSLPSAHLFESFIKHPDDQEFYFDMANGTMVDNQRWGEAIPLLLNGPLATRLVYQNATREKLSEYGFDAPNIIATITLTGGAVYEIQVGNSNPEGTIYYVRSTENSDVYTVDKSWSDVLSGIITDPPYIPATLTISNLTISPTTVNVGQPANITVNITNSGNVTGTFNIMLFINSNLGDMRTQTITLAARGSQVVTFTVIENAAGPYNASINQKINESFTVQ